MKKAKIRVFFLVALVIVLFAAAFLYNSLSLLEERQALPDAREKATQEAEPAVSAAPASGQAEQSAETFSFTRIKPYSEGHVYKLAWADFDNDGFQDLAIANYDRQNYLFVNREGEFYSSPQFGSGYSIDIAWADFNQDGFEDLVVLRNKQKSSLYINNGDKSFTELPVFRQGHARAMAVADFNNDGFPDVFVGHGSEPSYLYINDGKGGFSEHKLSVSWNINALAACDLDGDGYADIVVGTEFRQNYILINNGDGTFTISVLSGEKAHTRAVFCADLNNNGMPDIIVGNNHQASNEERNYIYINNGNFDFTKMPALGASRTYAIDAADFNSDGLLDVVIGNYNQESYIYLNRGDFNFERAYSFENDYLHDVKAADINNNGLVDLSTALDKNGLNIFINTAGKDE